MNLNHQRGIHLKRGFKGCRSCLIVLLLLAIAFFNQSCQWMAQSTSPVKVNPSPFPTSADLQVSPQPADQTSLILEGLPPIPGNLPLSPPSAQISNPSQTSSPMVPPGPTRGSSATDTTTPEPTLTPTPGTLVFSVIGDYGGGNPATGDVVEMMVSWQPEFIITVGDNNYPVGAADHMDEAVGQFFHHYISPYQGDYGDGAVINRFFPTLGNHDMLTDNGRPYLDYFTLPGNERYYDFVWGPVHLYALDNLDTEPDGVGISSIQAAWLQERLATSSSPWNIVYMHYPPYSSGTHGSTDWARWPFSEWGADAVLSGHDHTYERLSVDGVPYFVNGLGGYTRYNFLEILEGSQVRFNSDYGAMRVEASDDYLLFQFFNRDYVLIDQVEMRK
jgi:hypothetical protein